MDDEQAKKVLMKFMLRQWKLKNSQKDIQQEEIVQEIEQVQQVEENKPTDDASKLVYSREEYAQQSFWEDRYKEHGGMFDWYVEWPELKPYIEELKIPKDAKILQVGCGNSKLSEQMYKEGYHNIVSIDISETVIARMAERNKEMQFLVMDATEMTFEDNQFDYSIDKGTLDALSCGDNSLAIKLLANMKRVSKHIIVISHSSVQKRSNIMQDFIDAEIAETTVNLSGQSELINIIRSNLKDKPISHVLKDKTALVQCLQQFQLQSALNKFSKRQPFQKINLSLISQQQLEKQADDDNDSNKEPQLVQEQQVQQGQTENKVQEEQESDYANKLEQTQNEPDSQQIQKKHLYAPKRQSFCYIYIITK